MGSTNKLNNVNVYLFSSKKKTTFKKEGNTLSLEFDVLLSDGAILRYIFINKYMYTYRYSQKKPTMCIIKHKYILVTAFKWEIVGIISYKPLKSSYFYLN